MPQGRKRSVVDKSLFEAALMGFEQMRRNVEEKISEIRQQLGMRDGATGIVQDQHARRPLSAAARRRISAAQKKRWATTKAQAKPARVKRTMSAAARKRIAAAQRKRWAAIKTAQAKNVTKRTAASKPASKAAQTMTAAS